MSESQIQNDLFLFYGKTKGGKRARLMADNIFLFSWESDFLVLNSSDYYLEFEIKCTKVDYFNDFKKTDRHRCLSGKIACRKPNRFYYICPAGLIDVKDIPPYAGLMYYSPGGKFYDRFVVVKEAPFLHRTKMNLFKELCVKYYYKYLNLRKK